MVGNRSAIVENGGISEDGLTYTFKIRSVSNYDAAT